MQGGSRLPVIGIISFLTLVDLFATQAILPSLAAAYGQPPAVMGSAVNACTLGMAVSGFLVACFSHRIPRRAGVSTCLFLLAVPTLLLALMPDLTTFAVLRVVQGFFMSAAFSLTIAYLSENHGAREAAGALAAYVTGNVASNLFGRLLSAAVADHLGLSANFFVFAGLNVVGAVLAFAVLDSRPCSNVGYTAVKAQWGVLLRRPLLLAGLAIGFLILFAFIGTFTYINFVLTSRLGLSPMQLGFVYFVFVPSIVATPFAGRAVAAIGIRKTVIMAFALTLVGLMLLLPERLTPVLAGLALVAAGTFFAQAAMTGFVGRAAGRERGSAGGLYLASYYSGGLAGSLVLGLVFDRLGWNATVLVIAASIMLAGVLATALREQESAAPAAAGAAG